MRSSALACCLLLSLGACSDRATNSVRGDIGGTFVIGLPGTQPAPIFPPLAFDDVSRIVVDQVYEKLASIGQDLNTRGDRGFTPRLARTWAWSPDSMEIAFSLDPRARWHDGHPVRASDVRFSFDLDKDPKTGTPVTPTIANIDSVTVRDSLTAVAWFHRRTPEQFYDFVYQVYIVPEHLLKDTPHDKLATSDLIRHPTGTGRFRFVAWDPGVRLELLADTANYRGRPKLDRIIFSFSSDANASVTKLMSGQADLADHLPAEMIPRLDSTGKIRALRYPALSYAFMGMNFRDPKRGNAPHPVFGDRLVRLAVSMGLDRQAMLRNVFDTLGVLGAGPFPRALADTTVTLPPFDRARAAALLDSAGWRAGPDGMRSKNSKPLTFTILVPTSSAQRMRYSVLIQEQLKTIGIKVDIESMDISSFIPRVMAKNFDAMMMLFQTDPSVGGIKQNWATEGIGSTGFNMLAYSNPRFDALIDSAVTTLDANRAKQLAHRAYQTLVDDAPAVWLYDPPNIAGVHKRLHPEGVRADGWWLDLADWWIPANERIDRDRIGLRPAQP